MASRVSVLRVGLEGFAEGDEFGVAEDAAGGDFGEFDLGFDFGAQPKVAGTRQSPVLSMTR